MEVNSVYPCYVDLVIHVQLIWPQFVRFVGVEGGGQDGRRWRESGCDVGGAHVGYILAGMEGVKDGMLMVHVEQVLVRMEGLKDGVVGVGSEGYVH